MESRDLILLRPRIQTITEAEATAVTAVEGQESRQGGIGGNDEGIACEADIVWIVGGGRGVGNLESTFMGVDNAGQL